METSNQPSLMSHFLNMLRISNTPMAQHPEEDGSVEVVNVLAHKHAAPLNPIVHQEQMYIKFTAPPRFTRRESLLTRAIMASPNGNSPSSQHIPILPRGMSTTSTHSIASTAELTSDGDLTTPDRSASPSPPPPVNRHRLPTNSSSHVVMARATNQERPDVAVVGEAAVEKSLGRKRCVMFACGNTSPTVKETAPVLQEPQPEPELEPAPRKCRLTFACPTRPSEELVSRPTRSGSPRPRRPSPTPASRKASPAPDKAPSTPKSMPSRTVKGQKINLSTPKQQRHRQQAFHEFASSHDETDSWVDKASELNRPKLTLDDCLKKENVIRRIGEEAEEEAEEEEREQEELDDEFDEEVEDDFAPSDEEEEEEESDGGNESDDEEGFADSDDESDGGSEYQFWAPAAPASTANTNDTLNYFSARQRSNSGNSSLASVSLSERMPRPAQPRDIHKRRTSKFNKMRPGTPELPDSTDFVCGTLDEDRPMEAAYISCREQRKLEKHILIPQDIDPSFPTTDPEDEEDEDEDDDVAHSADHMWIKDQFRDSEEGPRGRRESSLKVGLSTQPQPAKRSNNRSPPPPKATVARSPARRLFSHSPTRTRSPAPTQRLRSPRGSPTHTKFPPLGITINRLAQRPHTDRTSSLPQTPNPFFRNWENGSPATSRVTSAAVTPGAEEVRPDMHVRGPVDIVIGLEKKRQKRKEKFWRQHCRKVARDGAERKPAPGTGAVRMKELGLDRAERTRGYGLNQPAQLVLSL